MLFVLPVKSLILSHLSDLRCRWNAYDFVVDDARRLQFDHRAGAAHQLEDLAAGHDVTIRLASCCVRQAAISMAVRRPRGPRSLSRSGK